MKRLILLLPVLAVIAALLFLWKGSDSSPTTLPPSSEPAAGAADPAPQAAAPLAAGAPATPGGRTAAEAAPAAAGGGDNGAVATARTLKARLVNEAGDPVAGGTLGVLHLDASAGVSEEAQALLMLRAVQGEHVEGYTVLEGRSDAAGLAQVVLPGDDHFALLGAYAYAPDTDMAAHWLQGEQAPSGGDFDLGTIVLRPGASLDALVQDEAGKPFPGALVLVMAVEMTDWQGDQMPWFGGTSGADGHVRFTHLGQVDFAVSALLAGYTAATADPLRPAEEPMPAARVLVLRRGELLEGLVQEADGSAAAGVKIRVQPEHGRIESAADALAFGTGPWAETGADGRFQCFGLEAGRAYQIRAERDAVQWVEQDSVHAGDPLVLHLPAASRLSGRLLEEGGAPAAGAKLFACAADQLQAWVPESGLVSSGADGAFVLPLQPGSYRLAAWHASGETVFEQTFEVRGASDAGELRLPAGGALELSLVDADGQPVHGGSVNQADEGYEGWGDFNDLDHAALERHMELMEQREQQRTQRMLLRGGRPRAQETSPGVFHWDGLAPGHYRFEARAADCAPLLFEADIVAGECARQRLQMGPSASLELTVRKADGSVARGVFVYLRPLGAADAQPDSFGDTVEAVGSSGKVSFPNLRPGSYGVLEGFGYWNDDAPPLLTLNLAPGPNTATLTLPPRYSLVVTVNDAAGPVAGVQVRAYSDDDDAPYMLNDVFSDSRADDATDATGVLVLKDLAPGRYRVEATRPGGYPCTVSCDLQSEHQPLAIQLDGLRIEGVVEAAPAACSVILRRSWSEEELRAAHEDFKNGVIRPVLARDGGLRQVSAACDDSGRFVFHDLPAGGYTLEAHAEGCLPAATVAVSLEQRSVADVHLRLRPAAKLVLHVSGMAKDRSSGRRAQAVRVDSGDSAATVWIRGDGDYPFPELEPGSYTVRILDGRRFEQKAIAELPAILSEHAPTVLEWDASRTP